MSEIKEITWEVARKIKGVNQMTAAKEMSVTQQTLSRWENYVTEPTISQARKLAAYYGVDLSIIKT